MRGEGDTCEKFGLRNVEETKHMKDIGVDGRILKLTFKQEMWWRGFGSRHRIEMWNLLNTAMNILHLLKEENFPLS
jgi:hypothetical protein